MLSEHICCYIAIKHCRCTKPAYLQLSSLILYIFCLSLACSYSITVHTTGLSGGIWVICNDIIFPATTAGKQRQVLEPLRLKLLSAALCFSHLPAPRLSSTGAQCDTGALCESLAKRCWTSFYPLIISWLDSPYLASVSVTPQLCFLPH